jgi:hypothetical protein
MDLGKQPLLVGKQMQSLYRSKTRLPEVQLRNAEKSGTKTTKEDGKNNA